MQNPGRHCTIHGPCYPQSKSPAPRQTPSPSLLPSTCSCPGRGLFAKGGRAFPKGRPQATCMLHSVPSACQATGQLSSLSPPRLACLLLNKPDGDGPELRQAPAKGGPGRRTSRLRPQELRVLWKEGTVWSLGEQGSAGPWACPSLPGPPEPQSHSSDLTVTPRTRQTAPSTEEALRRLEGQQLPEAAAAQGPCIELQATQTSLMHRCGPLQVCST